MGGRAAHWLRTARAQGYALPAFNAVNLESAQAVVHAAEAEGAPVILQISENAARYAGLGSLAAIGRELRQQASVPVMLHYDHAESLSTALQAIAQGFDMVMLEGIAGSATYRASLRELAGVAHGCGVAVEAEYEVVSKGERQATSESLGDIGAFVSETGCDALAVSIGSQHKQTEKDSPLDLTRLRQIAQLTSLPLVLHGASGVGEQDLSAAVKQGISKVNVATELMLVFSEAVRQSLLDRQLYDPRKYLGAGREAMTQRTRAVIRLLGTSHKATGVA